ncbi:MAG: hypothetical protein J3R72DRAFT_460257 [Linnemannia gamsii]|nr:MAG: hypothetical protein J3R72DRAFT_460257 [Linnemannia gamsii]
MRHTRACSKRKTQVDDAVVAATFMCSSCSPLTQLLAILFVIHSCLASFSLSLLPIVSMVVCSTSSQPDPSPFQPVSCCCQSCQPFSLFFSLRPFIQPCFPLCPIPSLFRASSHISRLCVLFCCFASLMLDSIPLSVFLPSSLLTFPFVTFSLASSSHDGIQSAYSLHFGCTKDTQSSSRISLWILFSIFASHYG